MRTEVQVELIRRFRGLLAEPDAELAPHAQSYPPTEYAGADRVRAEREVVFRRRPVVAAFSADVPTVGSYVASEIDGYPILVVRGEDGRARVLRNACRHRGVPVAVGRGVARRVFTCPFHAWSYTLDGSLHRQPGASHCFDIDHDQLGLVELPSDEAAGVILTRLDGDRVDATVTLGGLTDDFEAFDLAGHQHVETRTQVRNCNWKMIIDTFLEAYHVPFLHKQTIGPLYYSHPIMFDPLADHLRFVPIRRTFDELGDDPAAWSLLPHTTAHYVIFPNTLVVHQIDHIETWRAFPAGDDPGRSVVETGIYAAPGVELHERARGYLTRNLDFLLNVTNTEDFPQCEAAQRAYASGAGSDVVFGRNEPCLIHFHGRIHAALTAAGRARS